MSVSMFRRALGALILVAAIAAGSGSAFADGSAAPTPSVGTARAGLRFVGIELRPAGIGKCSPSTPAPCSPFVYRWQCESSTQARIARVRTYMIAADPSVVGYQLRARLVPRSQSAAGIPWAVDTETFASQPTAISRLMDAQQVSEFVEISRRWDLVVEVRFDRRGRPDDVRGWRAPIRFDCS